jgi:hypothetical protein
VPRSFETAFDSCLGTSGRESYQKGLEISLEALRIEFEGKKIERERVEMEFGRVFQGLKARLLGRRRSQGRL